MKTSAYANLLLRPDLGKKAYRLRCRFRVGAYPGARFLEKAKYAAGEQFIRDMQVRGWEYVDRYGFRMTGPYAPVEPTTIHVIRPPSSRNMLTAVAQGARFLPTDQGSQAQAMPVLHESENWEFELAGVFVHKTILTERPDPHEER